MDFTRFNSLSPDIRSDVALCALVKILEDRMTRQLKIMEQENKDTKKFVTTYGELIDEIASTPANVIESLKTLIAE